MLPLINYWELTCETEKDNAKHDNEQKFVHPGELCSPGTNLYLKTYELFPNFSSKSARVV